MMTDEAREHFDGIMNIRFYVYTLFVWIFDRPATEEVVEALKGETLWECLQTLAFDQGSKLWRGADFFASLHDWDAALLLERMQKEYAHLFLRETSPLNAPRKLKFQNKVERFPILLKVQPSLQRAFRALGFDPPGIQALLAYQLNIMADLCQSALSELQKGNFKRIKKLLSIQREELEEELLPKVSELINAMTGMTECELYSRFVITLASFLQGERSQIDALAELIEPIQPKKPSGQHDS